MSHFRPCLLINQGLTPYQDAWSQQKLLVQERIEDPTLPDVLMVVEHPPVYTLGTGSTLEFLKFDPNHAPWEVHRIERGGEVTYHAPGQLVVYPILNLKFYQPDLHWYLRQLEEVIIQVLALYGLRGDRISGLTGVWINGAKVAAMGIKVRRWLTMHGFAINVCLDMSGFERIIPCGIADKPVCQLTDFQPQLTLEQVRQDTIRIFAQHFQVKILGSNSPSFKTK